MALGASEWFQVILGASEWFQVVLFGSECWGRGEAQRYLSNPTLLKHADPNPASQISFLLFSFSSPSDLQHRADLLAGSGVSPQVEEPQCCRCSPQVPQQLRVFPFPALATLQHGMLCPCGPSGFTPLTPSCVFRPVWGTEALWRARPAPCWPQQLSPLSPCVQKPASDNCGLGRGCD